MAKELTAREKLIRQKARQLARAAGRSWKDISKDERKTFLGQARKTSLGSARGGDPNNKRAIDPAREQAKLAAEKDGLVWRNVPKEERQKYLTQARDERTKQLVEARRQKP